MNNPEGCISIVEKQHLGPQTNIIFFLNICIALPIEEMKKKTFCVLLHAAQRYVACRSLNYVFCNSTVFSLSNVEISEEKHFSGKFYYSEIPRVNFLRRGIFRGHIPSKIKSPAQNGETVSVYEQNKFKRCLRS